MRNQATQLPWNEPGWLEQASSWIQTELARQGIQVNGPIEQPHIRPWSTVLRVPTSSGKIFFKATSPVLAHEPALTQALSLWRPDCMPPVLATDLVRGWMLVPDLGEMLRAVIYSEQDLQHWRHILPLYAELQIEMAGRLHALLSLGALDRRLAVLPQQYERLLADTGTLRIDQPEGLTTLEYQQLRELTPVFSKMCLQLSGAGIPETLHHDDFHDGNIFMRHGHYIFSDWAESCASHPFFTMVVTLRSIAYRFKLAEDAPEISQLRDIYLQPWQRYASHIELLEAFVLARQVGMANRAMTWHRVVSSLGEPYREQEAGAVPGWLQEFLKAVHTT